MTGWGYQQAGHWFSLGLLLMLGAWILHLRRQLGRQSTERLRERRLREELEAYAEVDASVAQSEAGGMDRMEACKALAKRVCRVVAEKSAFSRVGMVLRDVEGKLYCAGSVGVDDLTVRALNAWGQRVVEEERGLVTATGAPSASRPGTRSFSIALGEWSRFDPEIAEWERAGKRERRRWRRALVAPVRTGNGRLAGALVVCADGPRGRERKRFTDGLERAMGPIEALAARLSGTLENETLGERLRRAERMAGLGQLAGGVAHALNNPLTAVLGFAELIAETSGEMRVRQDAETIRAEALKMRETVERLHDFWRPSLVAEEQVDVAAVARQLATECEGALRERGLELEVQAPAELPTLRGSRARIRQLLEQLLNNAAQSIGVAQRNRREELAENRHLEPEEPHGIRITLTDDRRTLHLIVSDTGTGFDEPGRAFDPFYTTKGPEAGAGLGLSISFGIVREHGGEITAFNLHPRGAAVVVELPLVRAVRGTGPVLAERERLSVAS